MNLKKLNQSIQSFVKNPPSDFDPTTDMNDAMLVVEALQDMGYQVDIQITANGTDTYLSTAGLNTRFIYVNHESTPVAICLLAEKIK